MSEPLGGTGRPEMWERGTGKERRGKESQGRRGDKRGSEMEERKIENGDQDADNDCLVWPWWTLLTEQ